jgi:hypothetical protein
MEEVEEVDEVDRINAIGVKCLPGQVTLITEGEAWMI